MNFVASTLTKGALANLANLRAISVLPTPVGPIMSIFFGVTSDLKSRSRFMRRQRFLRAIATDRLAVC